MPLPAGAARRPLPPSTTGAWTTSPSRCRSSSRRSAWRSTPTGWSMPRSPTSCSRGWRCSRALRMLLDQHYQEVFGFEFAAACGLRRAQADVRRHGWASAPLGRSSNTATQRAAAAAAPRIGLVGRGAGVGCLRACCDRLRAGGRASRSRIVSLDLCTDQLLVELVDRARIAAVTHLAADPTVSAIPEKARGIPITRGAAEDVLRYDPDLILAGPVRRLGQRRPAAPARPQRRRRAAAAGPRRRAHRRAHGRRRRSARSARARRMIADFDRRLARLARVRRGTARPRPSSTRSAARYRAPAAWPMPPSPRPAFATWRATIA